jgi:hypothetical protein
MQHDAAQAVPDEMHALRVEAAHKARQLLEDGIHGLRHGAVGEAVTLIAVRSRETAAHQRRLGACQPQAMNEDDCGFHGITDGAASAPFSFVAVRPE